MTILSEEIPVAPSVNLELSLIEGEDIPIGLNRDQSQFKHAWKI